MMPKLKRKKYAQAGGVYGQVVDPSMTQAFVNDEYGNQIPTNTPTGASLQASQTNALSGIGAQGVGSATPTTPSMTSDANTANAMTLAGTMGLGIASKAVNSSAPKTTAGYMTRQALKDASSGAQLGSTIGGIAGSFIPGVGNAVGAAAGAMTGAEIGAIEGAARGYFQGRKAKKQANFEDDQARQERKSQMALAQQLTDPTIGTQQTNPVYGMKHGGSLYAMGGGIKKKSTVESHIGTNQMGPYDSGIVVSNKNGVDRTKASFEEGSFVIPAKNLARAKRDGILDDNTVSPNQGGVPIMISGGEVGNKHQEGVIAPGRVKQLLAMGVDLDSYAPNAKTSLYDLAGTRKNVMNGGRLGYATGNYVLSDKGYQAINDFEAGIGTFRTDKTKPNYGVPISMGTDNTYAQTADKDAIDSYIEKYVGQSQWNKMPDELKTQFRSFLFNHGVTDLAGAKGLAEAVLNTTGNDPRGNTTSFKNRQGISEQDAIDIIKNADFTNKDIYNNYVNVLGDQYGLENIGKGMPEKYKDTLGGRAVDIHRLYTGDITAQDLIDRREGAITSQQQALNKYNGVQSPTNSPANPPSNNLWDLGNSEFNANNPPQYKIENLETNPVTPPTPGITDRQINIDEYTQEPYITKPEIAQDKTAMTPEEKLYAVQMAGLGLRGGINLWQMAHNARQQRTPMPAPSMYWSQQYSPNLSAMDAAQKQAQAEALATQMYYARQFGGRPEAFNAMYANQLKNQLDYNVQRTGVEEAARQANIAQFNKDMATNLERRDQWRTNEAAAIDTFKQAKAEALSKNLESFGKQTQEGIGYYGQNLYNKQLAENNEWVQANSLAPTLSHSTFTPDEFYNQKDAIKTAQKTLLSYKTSNPDKYNKLSGKISTMSPVDAAKYVEENINRV